MIIPKYNRYLRYIEEMRNFNFKVISLGDGYFSFPEFEIKDDFNHRGDFSFIFTVKYPPSFKNEVVKYQKMTGRTLSFEEFFDLCSPETKENIIFNYNFFDNRL